MANPHIQRATIEDEVRAALDTTLRHDAEAIDLESSIVTDLGATSIDFLDINFRLESAFSIRLATQLLLDHVEEELGEGCAIDKDPLEEDKMIMEIHIDASAKALQKRH